MTGIQMNRHRVCPAANADDAISSLADITEITKLEDMFSIYGIV
jgi:hypothetical protein